MATEQVGVRFSQLILILLILMLRCCTVVLAYFLQTNTMLLDYSYAHFKHLPPLRADIGRGSPIAIINSK